MTAAPAGLVIEGILTASGFVQTNGASFTEWLAQHEAEVWEQGAVEGFMVGRYDTPKPPNPYLIAAPTSVGASSGGEGE